MLESCLYKILSWRVLNRLKTFYWNTAIYNVLISAAQQNVIRRNRLLKGTYIQNDSNFSFYTILSFLK